MTQEININITVTIEADVERTDADFESFLCNVFTGAVDTDALSINKYHINKILTSVIFA